MQNVSIVTEGTKVLIEIDTSKPTTPSSTGKTQVLASTRGNTAVALPDGRVLNLGVNAYFK